MQFGLDQTDLGSFNIVERGGQASATLTRSDGNLFSLAPYNIIQDQSSRWPNAFNIFNSRTLNQKMLNPFDWGLIIHKYHLAMEIRCKKKRRYTVKATTFWFLNNIKLILTNVPTD